MSFRSLSAALLHVATSVGARTWVAGLLVLLIVAAEAAWWFWPQALWQTEATGCVARTPGIAEAAADYDAYLREHCGPDSADGGSPAK